MQQNKMAEASLNNESIDRQPINFKALIGKYLYHWPIFLLSIVITLTASVLYLRYTLPVYEITSSLLIKEGDKNPSEALLGDLGMVTDDKVVEDETQVLRSKPLMQSVVVNLNANVSYFNEGSITALPIYGKSPIKLYTIEYDPRYTSYKLTFKYLGRNRFELKNSEGEVQIGEFGKIYHSFFGTWKIDNVPANAKLLNWYISIIAKPKEDAANKIIGQLMIELQTKGSRVLSISLRDEVPQRGIDILNQLTQEYDRASVQEKNRVTDGTLRFVTERLDSLTGELNVAERNVENFKSSKGLTDITSEAQMFLSNINDVDEKISAIEIQLGVINVIDKQLNSDTFGEVPTTLGLDDPVLLQLLSKLSEAEQQRAKLLANGTTDNPVLAPILTQIKSTKRAIRESVSVLRNRLVATKDNLNRTAKKMEGSIRNVPTQERQFIGLKRDQTIKDNLVTYLLQKREEAAL
ncbi:MAG: hypothetical protein EOO07_23310, partial [Chitinophagaceae bacterium]